MNIPSSMKALQLQAPNQLVLAEIPLPVAGKNEVLIQTKATTICTSDLHDIKSNPFGIQLPNVLGHEGAGVIVQCGSEVKHLTVGMRVGVHPVVPCGYCVECQRNFQHLCLNMGHLGIDRTGTFGAYFVQRADRVRQLPDHIPFTLGALLEPVANCLQAISRSGAIRGKIVLVAGDGPFGNIIARLAVRAGAARVLVSGKEPFRLSRIPGVEIVDRVPEKLVDVAILAVSSANAVEACMKALRKRGRMVVFSLLQDAVPIDLFNLHISELEIAGCCNDEDQIDNALACLEDKTLNLSELITQEIPFDSWEEAFYLARDRHDKALKVALIF